jgi:hypothetical protein
VAATAAGTPRWEPGVTAARLNHVGRFGAEIDGSGIFLRISKPL